MRRAEYGKGGELLSLKAFMDRAGSDDPKKWIVKPHCHDCGEEVFAYDKRGARGFHAARDEVTKHVPRTKPGFHHYPVDPADTTSPVLTCPSSFRDDPRFKDPRLKDLMDSMEFRRDELERNTAALSEPKMAAALEKVQRFFMHRLTGKSVLSDDDQKDIKKITKGLITMAGLSQHPWVLPYMQALFVGARTRLARSHRRTYKAAYDNQGTQKLPVQYANKETGWLTVPRSIVLGFKGKSGKITPMRYQGGQGAEISFPVSRDFAASIFLDGRSPSKKPEAARTPPRPAAAPVRAARRVPGRSMAPRQLAPPRPSKLQQREAQGQTTLFRVAQL
ncbi:MAG: hypothetical protein SFW62_00415 [Alphaproteobacteria bacterium]|nr:hypothetical protein [Alphaproteobacteria bacterium]